MLKYSDRDYYEKQVVEIKECIKKTQGKDNDWAHKVIKLLEGEKGAGRHISYQARKHLSQDVARINRLCETMNDLFDHAVQKTAPLLTKPYKPKPKPKPPEVNMVLFNEVMTLLTVPKKHADSHLSIRAKNAIDRCTDPSWGWSIRECLTIEQVVNAPVSQLVKIENVGFKAAKFIFLRLEPLRNKPVDTLGIDKV